MIGAPESLDQLLYLILSVLKPDLAIKERLAITESQCAYLDPLIVGL